MPRDEDLFSGFNAIKQGSQGVFCFKSADGGHV
jgi:hypothetical protein